MLSKTTCWRLGQLTSLLDLAPLARELNVDDVSETLLRIVGDAYGADVGLGVEGDPLVLWRVARLDLHAGHRRRQGAGMESHGAGAGHER